MNINEQIFDLFEFTINDTSNTFKRIDLGIVSHELGQLIKMKTSIDVTNYVISMDTFSIKHTIERHGNPIKEAKLGQIAVQKEHFVEILDVILNPDNVRYNVGSHNRESLIFEKEKEGKFFVVKEIRKVLKSKKKNRIVLQTFYIKKTP